MAALNRITAVILKTLTLITVISKGLSQITQKEYSFIEEQPTNTYIGNLIQDLGLNLKVDQQFHKDIKFHFLQQSLVYKDYFSIEDGTGIFRTKQVLDRDTMCSGTMNDNCDIILDISILQAQHFEIFKVIIHLVDINDNIPTFPVNQKALFISETTSTGASFAIPAATDKDSSKYGIQRYVLDTATNNFELDIGSSGGVGGAGLSDPRLVLKHALDREKNAFYSVKVLAVDGGVPAQTGSVTVEITVTDANDNPPRFDNTTYQITIEENTPLDTTILQVYAQDTDVGDNGQVFFTFSQATSTTFSHLFSLDSQSGSIVVKGLIDYDAPANMHQFTLSIVASDSGQNALSDYATVTIFVKDINDNKPKIVLNIAGSNNSVTISEDAPIDSFVTHISVIDPDEGPSGEVVCNLDHAYFRLVKLHDKQYKLVTASTLDRESQDQYRVSLTCQDGGSLAPLSTTQYIKIIVTDENDHRPVFQQLVYPVAIRENNQVHIQISQVKATDGDINKNARISYSILEPNDQLLSIDENNGFINTKRVFDYEYKKYYDVTVVARDNGNPSLSANATVSLTILDSNDEPPRFNQTHYTFGTLENQHAGTEIGTIEATDLDSEPYNDIVYTIDIHSPDASVFKIPDPKTGKITLRKVLNREEQDKYTILVIASNPGYSLHTSTNVTIFVGDENDNPPVLQFPNLINNSVQVSSYAKKGEVVSQIAAHDADVGKNSYLTYSILAGNVHSVFMINPNTGEIFVNKSLESYKEKDIKLSILVKDKGDPPLSKVAQLQIFVNSSKPLAVVSPVSRTTTNIQLIIILCLSVLAISLFLAVLIVLVTMKRKKNMKKQENRYKLDITFAPVTGNGTTSIPNSVTNSPISERKDETDSDGKHNRSGEVMGQPPPYSESGNSPNINYLAPRPDSRKVHFAETDSAYDSLDKENEENGDTAPYLQLAVGNRGGMPTIMEQQRHRLLYRSPTGSPARSADDLQIQNHGDMESDQGSSIDSGRGPSEDEHGRLNTSLQGPYISFIPDPNNRQINNKKPHQQSYPDLVNCVCGIGSKQNPHQKYKNPVHRKGCPQHHSPTHDSGSKIDNLHDFQNLLGLPPKSYNKQQRSSKNSKNNNLNVPSGHFTESSVSSSPHSNNSRHHHHPSSVNNQHLDSSYSSNPPQSPQGTNNFTQQCYDDISQQKISKYGGGGGGGSSIGSQQQPNNRSQPHHQKKQRDSWRGGDDSDGESDGGSTTTSGSFSVVGSVENVAPTNPIQKLHQVYV